MSVIQISKIQVRRGKKLSGIGVPQLSSAEFAWAVDTQELFIGNGSLNEGAPYVGNTKIITENDNILELAAGYRFSSSNPSIDNSVPRSVQSKLDEYVSVIDFGAVPDGSTDCTEAFNKAFQDLALNSDDKFKKVLFVPNGNYLIFSDLKIPSNTILKGENKLETVIDIGSNDIILISESGTEPGGFSSGDIPHDIIIENLTIDHGIGQTIVSGSSNCTFENVRWRSNYTLGETVFVSENANAVYSIPIVESGGNIVVTGTGVTSTVTVVFADTYIATLTTLVNLLNADPVFDANFIASVEGTALKITSKTPSVALTVFTNNFTVTSLASSVPGNIPLPVSPVLTNFTDGSQDVPASIYFENLFYGIRTNNLKINDCLFDSVKLAIELFQSDVFNTEIEIRRTKFFNCDTGIYVAGRQGQGNNWIIEDCEFNQIARYAMNITAGRNTKVHRSKFFNCGNNTGSPAYPVFPIVKFSEYINNTLIDCSSDRHQQSQIVSVATTKAVTEFEMAALATFSDRNYSLIYLENQAPPGGRPLAVFGIGNKFIEINYVLTLGSHKRLGKLTISVNDTTNVGIGAVAIADSYTFSSGGTIMTGFQFSASLRDNDSDGSNDTVLLRYTNPTATGALGSISYSVSYGV